MRKMISCNLSSRQMDLRKPKNLLSNRHPNPSLTRKLTRRTIMTIVSLTTKTGRITMMSMMDSIWMTKLKMSIRGSIEKTIGKSITIMRNSMPMKKTIVSFMKNLNLSPKSSCCRSMRRPNTSSKGNLDIAILGWSSIEPTGIRNSINGAKTSWRISTGKPWPSAWKVNIAVSSAEINNYKNWSKSTGKITWLRAIPSTVGQQAIAPSSFFTKRSAGISVAGTISSSNSLLEPTVNSVSSVARSEMLVPTSTKLRGYPSSFPKSLCSGISEITDQVGLINLRGFQTWWLRILRNFVRLVNMDAAYIVRSHRENLTTRTTKIQANKSPSNMIRIREKKPLWKNTNPNRSTSKTTTRTKITTGIPTTRIRITIGVQKVNIMIKITESITRKIHRVLLTVTTTKGDHTLITRPSHVRISRRMENASSVRTAPSNIMKRTTRTGTITIGAVNTTIIEINIRIKVGTKNINRRITILKSRVMKMRRESNSRLPDILQIRTINTARVMHEVNR